MKISVAALLCVMTPCLSFAQVSFEPVPPPMPLPQITYDFIKVSGSSAAFADVNGDGYLDVLITGDLDATSSIGTTVGLYINNGRGSYSQAQNVPFTKVTAGSVDFADIDGDGDPDVLITGYFNATNTRARLYKNDGNGNFTVLANGTTLLPVGSSDADFADIDGDGDLDMLITGSNGQDGTARLYENDGSGIYTLVESTPFTPVSDGSVDFGDVDGDNDPDVLITGLYKVNSNTRITSAELYLNDGAGNFTVATNLSISKVHRSTANFADLDGDNDLDVFITGDTTYNGNDGQFSAMYINDGSGGYTISEGSSFTNVEKGAVDIADIDHDGDQDILLTGYKGLSNIGNIAELYTNDGSGNFTMTDNTTFPKVANGSVSFADINGDSTPDVLVTGNKGYNLGGNVASLYYPRGAGNFTIIPRSPVIEVGNSQQYYAAAAFADVDNDGDPDLIVSGQTDSTTATILYYNWQGEFRPDWDVTERPVSALPTLSNTALDFADVDNDGDQDVLIAGYGRFPGESTFKRLTVLYKYNLDTKIYEEADRSTFTAVTEATIRFADVDKDGDQDVLVMGSSGNNTFSTELYLNDGTGNYSLSSNPFTNMSRGDAAFADVNGDGYPDLFLTGSNAGKKAELYLNDGSGGFSLHDDQTFEKVNNSSVDFADVDGDNDMDLFVSGDGDGSYNTVGNLYINDGTGSFTLQAGSSFKGVKYSAMAFSDLDADGDPDLILTGIHYPGSNTSPVLICEAYTNDGSGNFTVVGDSPFWGYAGVQYGDLAVSDIDNDNYDDVLFVGWSHSGRSSALFKNTACEDCEPDPCANVTCAEGEVCYLGACFIECDTTTEVCTDLGPNLVGDAGTSMVLEAGPDFDIYLWSTGDTTRTILVDASGTYWVTAYDLSGSFFSSDTVNVLVRAASDGSCPEGYTNRDGYCFPPDDPCNGTTCPEGLVCYYGTCYDPCANDGTCDPDDVCYADACYTEALCENIICPEGLYCYEGSCYDSCANDTQVYLGPNLIGPSDSYIGLDAGGDFGYYEWSTGDTTKRVITNASGQYWVVTIDTVSNTMCTDTVKILISANQLGECPEGLTESNGYCYRIDDPCEGIVCPEGWACFGGSCFLTEACDVDSPDSECFVEAPCDNVVCPEGYECDDGNCVPLKNKGYIGSPGSSIRLNSVGYFNYYFWSTGERTESIEVDVSGQYTYKAVTFSFPSPWNPEGSAFNYQDTINVLIQVDPVYGCPEGQVERDGYCFLPNDPCEGVTCPTGYVCFEGTCYPECDADSTYADGFCYKGIHFKYPDCEDLLCPSPSVCLDGQCYRYCYLPSDCPEGTVCTDEESCVPQEIACNYIYCDEGYQCVFGACLEMNILDNGAYNLTGVLFIDDNPGGRMTGNGPIGNTTIYLLNESETEINGITTTDADGNYSFENLPSGTYTIFVDQAPYKIKGDGKIILKQNIKFTTLDIVSDGVEFELRLSYITGLDKQFKGFSFYPNPTRGEILLSSTVDLGTAEVKIVDITGRVIRRKTLQIKKAERINIANLRHEPAGMKIIEIRKNGKLIFKGPVLYRR